ncbi:hypothetical protein JKY72_03950 [Candidatus Gracilibacteria bacterium]|nr:hypothetical protein [Candidatus Gracilibacteria bacterium]
MEIPKSPLEDLLLIQGQVENRILPAIEQGSFFDAKIIINNLLELIEQRRIQIYVHGGINLCISLTNLAEVLENDKTDIDRAVLDLRAYLAQALMANLNQPDQNVEVKRQPPRRIENIILAAVVAIVIAVPFWADKQMQKKHAAETEELLRRSWHCLSDKQKEMNCNRTDVPSSFKTDFCVDVEE